MRALAMRRGYFFRLAWLAVLCAAGSAYAGTEEKDVPSADHEIGAILACNLAHCEDCRSQIERVSRETAHLQVRHLAEVVLSEWDLDLEDSSLRSPRLVWAPERHYPEEIGNPRFTLTVIFGEITSDGKATEGHIHRSTESEIIDQICLDSFLQALYRPARTAEGYVTATGGLTCEVYLR